MTIANGDLDVLIHNSGNNWGAPLEEYVSICSALLSLARFCLVSSAWIEPPAPFHFNAEAPSPPSKISSAEDHPHWIYCRDECARA